MLITQAKQTSNAQGESMPKRIYAPRDSFWNVESRKAQQPVTMNENGVALVSGCSPRLFSMVASGELNPYKAMLDTLMSERYAPISA